jgi:hypothetical protein
MNCCPTMLSLPTGCWNIFKGLRGFKRKRRLVTKQKKIFVLVCVVFVGLLIYASYDISRRTTFPGSKPQLPERLKNPKSAPDSTVKKQ